MEQEIWKDVVGYEGLYAVSSLGRVKSFKYDYINGRFLNFIGIKFKKYFNVLLTKDAITKSFLVHRLVAIAFIKNIENKPQINHKDKNTNNNIVSNLEWCSSRENMIHAYSGKLSEKHLKHLENIMIKRKPVLGFVDNIKIYNFESASEAERQIGINQASISSCCLKKNKICWEI